MSSQVATWSGDTGGADRIRAAIWWAAVSLKRAWSRRRSRLVLSDLDDHVLRDIGLNPRDFRCEPSSLRPFSVRYEARLTAPAALGR